MVYNSFCNVLSFPYSFYVAYLVKVYVVSFTNFVSSFFSEVSMYRFLMRQIVLSPFLNTAYCLSLLPLSYHFLCVLLAHLSLTGFITFSLIFQSPSIVLLLSSVSSSSYSSLCSHPLLSVWISSAL